MLHPSDFFMLSCFVEKSCFLVLNGDYLIAVNISFHSVDILFCHFLYIFYFDSKKV